MLSKKSLVVGYDDDEITMMMPSDLRKVCEETCNDSCPNYEVCGKLRVEEVQPTMNVNLQQQKYLLFFSIFYCKYVIYYLSNENVYKNVIKGGLLNG